MAEENQHQPPGLRGLGQGFSAGQAAVGGGLLNDGAGRGAWEFAKFATLHPAVQAAPFVFAAGHRGLG